MMYIIITITRLLLLHVAGQRYDEHFQAPQRNRRSLQVLSTEFDWRPSPAYAPWASTRFIIPVSSCVYDTRRVWCSASLGFVWRQSAAEPLRLRLHTSWIHCQLTSLRQIHSPSSDNCWNVFTARCYASAVLAMALCPSVCPSVRHKSESY